ncbi:MAG: hypothetical protein HQL72_06815 [Magnetococcales bacterium]|nr:hypothetical protein [Magnetococcales bacterium]
MSLLSRIRKTAIRHLGLIRLPDGIGCVEVVEGEGKPQVTLCEFMAIPSYGARSAFTDFLQENNLKKVNCTVVLPMESYEVFAEEAAANISIDEMADAMRWSIKDRLDYSVADAVVDVFEMPPSPRATADMIYVAAAKKESILDLTENFNQVNRSRLQRVELHELGLRNISALLPESSDGLAMLHLRAHDALLVITRNNTLYLTRRIEVGLNRLLDSLVTLKEGQDPVDLLTECKQTKEICAQVQQALDYFGRRFQQNINRLYLAPPDRPLPELRLAISNHLAIRVKSLELESLFDFKEEVPEEKILSRILPALGAVLFMDGGEGRSSQRNVNLFDESFIPKPDLVSAANILTLQAALLVLFGVLTAVTYQQLSDKKEKLALSQQQQERLTKEVSQLEQEFRKPIKDLNLERKVVRQKALIKQKRMVLQILSGGYSFGNTKGFSGHFKELAKEPLDGIRILRVRLQNGGSVLRIDGKAESPELVPQLVSSFNDKINLSKHPFRILSLERPPPIEGVLAEGKELISFTLSTHPIEDEPEQQDNKKNNKKGSEEPKNKQDLMDLTEELIGQAIENIDRQN